jgi:pimeloyl-ACP methyl ester carboxylesterase
MKKIYCFSGLGADEKIFSNLEIHGCKLIYIDWLRPGTREHIGQYAIRMSAMIEDEEPILLGVSFGGIIAIEIAKHKPVKKVIIVSSIKTSDELPTWMRVAGILQLNKILPVRSNKITERFDDNQLGVTTENEKMLVEHYRKKSDPQYMDWAINQVLNWRNSWQPETLVHIHGDKDKMFPIRKLRPTHVIEGGTHIMIMN